MAPSATKFVAYYRVSTQRQGLSGLGLAAQETAVAAHIASAGGRLVDTFREIESGRNRERPALHAAILKAKLTRSTIVIAKLDRLARDYHFLRELQLARVRFIACDMPTANELTVNILAAVAEDEAVRISERTKAALAAAKARGVKLGGDRCGIGQYAKAGAALSAKVRSERANEQALDYGQIIDSIRSEGASTLREIADELNAREFTAPRGGAWSAVQVKRVLDRLQ